MGKIQEHVACHSHFRNESRGSHKRRRIVRFYKDVAYFCTKDTAVDSGGQKKRKGSVRLLQHHRLAEKRFPIKTRERDKQLPPQGNCFLKHGVPLLVLTRVLAQLE